MRILISSAGGKLIPLLTKFIRKDSQLGKIYIVGIDKKKIKRNLNFDRFYIVKNENKKLYINKLLNICKLEKIELIIPYSDFEAEIISKNKNKFSNLNIKVMVNDFDKIKIINNKYLTYKILKKNGIQVPRFKLIKSLFDIKKIFKFFKYPKNGIVIKPIYGIGGRGVIILKGEKDKDMKWLEKGKREKVYNKVKKNFSKKIFKNGSLMAMELLQDPAYDVDCLSLKNKKITVVRKRINPTGIPYKGNYIINDKIVENYCNKIIKVLKLNSLIDIDLLTSKNTKKPILLEVNPRPSGSVVTSYYANIPIFSYAIAKILNKKYSIKTSKHIFKKVINL